MLETFQITRQTVAQLIQELCAAAAVDRTLVTHLQLGVVIMFGATCLLPNKCKKILTSLDKQQKSGWSVHLSVLSPGKQVFQPTDQGVPNLHLPIKPMPFIHTPSLNIHYELTGAGQTVVVLIHGNFASWRWWRPTLDRLPSSYRAYAPDLRGCGDTDHPPTGYNIEQLAEDLHAFVTALGLPPFHLVGHSLGGAVALQFALQHPDQLHSLMLVAPAPAEGLSFFRSRNTANLPRPGRLFDGRDETSLDLLQSNYRLLRTLEANRPLLHRALRRMMPTLTSNETFKVLVDDAARMAPEAMVGFLQSLDAWNVQPGLESLELPVLILWGKKDILIPLPALQRMSRALKQARLVIWKSVGHSPQLEQPGHFVRLLTRFTGQGLAIQSQRQGWWNKVSRQVSNWLKHP